MGKYGITCVDKEWLKLRRMGEVSDCGGYSKQEFIVRTLSKRIVKCCPMLILESGGMTKTFSFLSTWTTNKRTHESVKDGKSANTYVRFQLHLNSCPPHWCSSSLRLLRWTGVWSVLSNCSTGRWQSQLFLELWTRARQGLWMSGAANFGLLRGLCRKLRLCKCWWQTWPSSDAASPEALMGWWLWPWEDFCGFGGTHSLWALL